MAFRDVEARFGNGWFDCTVLETRSDGGARVKWAYDGSEAEVMLVDLRLKLSTRMIASLEADHYFGVHSAMNCNDPGSSAHGETNARKLRHIAASLRDAGLGGSPMEAKPVIDFLRDVQHCAQECVELSRTLDLLSGYESTRLGWAKLDDLGRQEQAERGGLWALLRGLRHVWEHRGNYQNIRPEELLDRFVDAFPDLVVDTYAAAMTCESGRELLGRRWPTAQAKQTTSWDIESQVCSTRAFSDMAPLLEDSDEDDPKEYARSELVLEPDLVAGNLEVGDVIRVCKSRIAQADGYLSVQRHQRVHVWYIGDCAFDAGEANWVFAENLSSRDTGWFFKGDLAICWACGGIEIPKGPKMKKCSSCRHAHYCNAACQRKDWSRHKAACKAYSTTAF